LGVELTARTWDAHTNETDGTVKTEVADLAAHPREVVHLFEIPGQAHPYLLGAISATFAACAPRASCTACASGTACTTGTTRASCTACTTGTACTTLASCAACAGNTACATRTARASFTAGTANTACTGFTANAACTARTPRASGPVGQLLGADTRLAVLAPDCLGAALLHAVLPIDRFRADRSAAALRRIEACVSVVDRLHAREEKRRHQGEGQKQGSGGHRDGM
jgi:hypothetical protein